MQTAVRILLDKLNATTVDAFERWRILFQNSCGIDSGSLPDGGKHYFALQTAFAAVVRKTVRKETGLVLSDPYFAWTDVPACEIAVTPGRDSFGAVYQKLYPPKARKLLGEFYTPDWIAEFLLDRLDRPEGPFLDPACGSGVFLLAAVRAMLKQNIPPEKILERIHGFDLNPLAVLMAKANIAMTLGIRNENEIPVFHRDSILDEPLENFASANVFGNPPWLNWDRLPAEYRETTRSLWERYGLFNLSGKDARHGGAKKELAQLMIPRVADLFMKPGDRMAMLLPVSVFRTRLAGEGFRRFRLPDDTPLGVLRVDDFSGLPRNPFPYVAVKPAAILIEKGVETKYPVEYFVHEGREACSRFFASPVRPENSGSPWIVHRPDALPPPSGPSDYTARLGANTGGANGVFWLELLGESPGGKIRVRNLPECGKLRLPVIEAEIEKDLVFPLLCWGDVDRFQARTPSRFILLPQDVHRRTGIPEDVLRDRWPKTHDYLKQFEAELRRRAAFRKYQASAPFYSMYNINEETVSAWKVVWRRMDNRLRAAVVGSLVHPLLGVKPIVPQETCVLIACDGEAEANYLTDLLNSDPVGAIVASSSVAGSKGFGSPGILNDLGIKRFTSEKD